MWKKLAWLNVVVAVLLGLWVAFSTEWQAHRAAENYLADLTAGEYEAAFEHVSYFDEAPDLLPSVSKEEAQQIWLKRVRNFQKQGSYIKSYRELETWTNDTYPMGSVVLVIVEAGREYSAMADIHFNLQNKEWKVQTLRLQNPEGDMLINAIGGHIPTPST